MQGMRFGIGQPVARKEDPRFLTGRAHYVADLDLARQAHAVFLYSPHAHARIRAIDTAAAANRPGILAVLTGQDWAADGLGTLDPEFMPEDMGAPKGYRTKRPPLASGRVRYVGDRVAVVIAASEEEARDAIELIAVDYQPLPAVIRAEDAVKPGAPLVHEDVPGNVSVTIPLGNPAAAVEPVFAHAAHVTRLSLANNRITAVTMEPRGCLADYDAGAGRWTLTTSTQNVHGIRQALAHQILHVAESRIRVVARDVGGGFGMKGQLYAEEAVCAWAARRIGRPVKWVPTRTEALLGDNDGRDQIVDLAELALAADGRFLALRWTGMHNVGAYIEAAGAIPILFSLMLASTVYDIPAVSVTSRLVLTNTAPTVPYRGAGRPEAVYLMERLIDRAAHEMHIDPAELRRKNLIRSFPYQTQTGWNYDSGDFPRAMERAQALADWQGYMARHQASAAAGKLRGRGIVYYTDNTGIFNERMELRFDPSGELTIVAGTLSHGQGHETSYAQMAADWLGVPADQIRLAQADTDEVAIGRGTYGSRSMMIGGNALRAAADEVVERGRRFAAHFMEADAADIAFANGTFTIAGTDRAMPIREVAQMSFMPIGIPAELGIGLQGAGVAPGDVPTFPNGCHICEVEIDPETGAVALDRYTVVDDIGTVVNPLLAKGQIMGGVAQGAGQALGEEIVYDPDSGQLLTGSLMDYGLPRADNLPAFAVDFSPVPTAANPLGIKGVGEGGTVASTPTVMNAILDALAPLGVKDVPMPATPERVWRAIRAARTLSRNAGESPPRT